MTRDELVECAALLRAVRQGDLDAVRMWPQPLDVLAQQIVAACVDQEWREDDLFALVRRAYPYRDLTREAFDSVIHLLAEGVSNTRGRARVHLHTERRVGADPRHDDRGAKPALAARREARDATQRAPPVVGGGEDTIADRRVEPDGGSVAAELPFREVERAAGRRAGIERIAVGSALETVGYHVVVAVDGETVGPDETLDAKLAGKIDREVVLSVQRDVSGEPRELTILVTPVSYARIDDVFYEQWRLATARKVVDRHKGEWAERAKHMIEHIEAHAEKEK